MIEYSGTEGKEQIYIYLNIFNVKLIENPLG